LQGRRVFNLIIIDIEIYSFRDKVYIVHEALVDTGAGFCAVTKHLSEALDLPLMGEKIHLWQARDPLGLEKTQLRLRYNDNVYDVVGVIIDIPPEFRRSIKAGEECTRPKDQHPLSKRIILGENFLRMLPEDERKNLIGFGY